MARSRTTRTPDQTDAVAAAAVDHAALDEAGAAATTLGLQVALVEQQFPVDIPYQLDLYVSAIRQRATESAQRLLEIGRMLIVIREREPREVYQDAVERAGLSPRFAQRAMQAALKLADHAAIQSLGVSKALELLSEEDEVLADLEGGGTLAGLTLDEIDRMSVRELRATLREERRERADEKAAEADIVRRKDERINALMRERKRIERSAAREQAGELLEQLDRVSVEVATQIKTLRDTASAIRTVYEEAGEPLDEEVADRLEQCGQLGAKWAEQLADELGE
jgi:hypothetical protein